MWLLKQVIFYNNLVEKSHKDIYITQNDNSGGSKHTIPEIGQKSNECQLQNKCSIYHIRVISQYVSHMELQQNDLVYILLANLTKTLTQNGT